MNFSFWVHKYSGHEEEEEEGGVDAGQVQGVHIQEWVHVSKVCELFARNSLIDVVFSYLFKSPDGHDGHGMGLAVVEEGVDEHVVEWVHSMSYYGMGLCQHFHHKMRDGEGQGLRVVGIVARILFGHT